MVYSEHGEESPLQEPARPANPLEEHLGGRPSPWAMTLFWVSVAVLGVSLTLVATSLIL
jgi:hypothetical protein